jgi:hypothetical protein
MEKRKIKSIRNLAKRSEKENPGGEYSSTADSQLSTALDSEPQSLFAFVAFY